MKLTLKQMKKLRLVKLYKMIKHPNQIKTKPKNKIYKETFQ